MDCSKQANTLHLCLVLLACAYEKEGKKGLKIIQTRCNRHKERQKDREAEKEREGGRERGERGNAERERGLSAQINLHMEIRVILGTVLFNHDVLFF